MEDYEVKLGDYARRRNGLEDVLVGGVKLCCLVTTELG
jgi:hypothetical protein